MPVWGILQRIPQESEIDRYGGLAQATSELSVIRAGFQQAEKRPGLGSGRSLTSSRGRLPKAGPSSFDNGHVFRRLINQPIKEYQQNKS